MYSVVLAITCPFYKENGCTHTPIALAIFGTNLFRTRQSRETHIGVGGWLWGGRQVAFFWPLAKGDVSSSIALAGRGFLPKSCFLIKYSPLCNLQTETFLQNPKRTFLPCVPKFMFDICVGLACLGKLRAFSSLGGACYAHKTNGDFLWVISVTEQAFNYQ